jgi:sugar lactone lactonase YvrE
MKRLLLSALTALTLGACATPRQEMPAWPAPPATERIRLVRILSGGADVEGSNSKFWRRVAGMDAPRRMYHPVGIGVTAEGDVVGVSDQGISVLFIFDMKSKEVHQVEEANLGGAPVGVAMEGDIVWTVVPERKRVLSFTRQGKPHRGLELPDTERPTGLAIDAAQKLLYVVDTSGSEGGGHSVHVHDLVTGQHKATIGKKGSGPGELFFPTFVTVSKRGTLYVADTMNARVMEFAADGTFLRQIGERGDQFGHFDKPKGVATDTFGNLYVVDSFYSAVQIFNDDGKLLLFFGGRGDSPGFLSNPSGIAIDNQNRIYVTNGLNFRVDVYQLVNTQSADSQLQDGSRS